MAGKNLESRIKALEKKVSRLEDINEITKLQRVYSYYVMHMMRDEIYDCFADRTDVKLRWLEGTWYGKKGVARYFGVGDKKRPEPPPGFIHQVMPIAGVVDVAPDGKTAKARWYSFGGVATPDFKTGKTNPGIVGGIYEAIFLLSPLSHIPTTFGHKMKCLLRCMEEADIKLQRTVNKFVSLIHSVYS